MTIYNLDGGSIYAIVSTCIYGDSNLYCWMNGKNYKMSPIFSPIHLNFVALREDVRAYVDKKGEP
jgi:hypothetical protein